MFSSMLMHVYSVLTFLITRFLTCMASVWLLMYTQMIAERILLTKRFFTHITSILISYGMNPFLHLQNLWLNK